MQSPRRQFVLQIAILFLAPLLLFLTALHHQFVDLDDDLYVSLNKPVLTGLSAENTHWAFTTDRGGYWIPLTWLSLQLDATLSDYSPNQIQSRLDQGSTGELPSATIFHADNAFQHALAACLLFLLLRRAAGRPWPAFWLALLWAIHPLRVESVAWVTERKDTLSCLLGFLTLWLYTFTEWRPWLRHTAVALAFFASLLAKPLFMTLPLLLLLIDYWPYRRLPGVRTLLPKLPLFAIAAWNALLTLNAQTTVGASELLQPPLPTRLANAAIGYVRYLQMNIAPVGLSVRYPYDVHISLLAGALAATFLLLITVAFFSLRRSRPHLLVGWCWFLIALAPMAGFIQAGLQAYADRFSLLASVGLLIIPIYSLPAAARFTRPFITAAIAISVTFAVLTLHRIAVWRNSITLFTDALQAAPEEYDLHNNIGLAYARNKDFRNAALQLRRAAELRPDYSPAIAAAFRAYQMLGDHADALDMLRDLIHRDPENATAHDLLGVTLASLGDLQQAIDEFQTAIRLDPGFPRYQTHLEQARAALAATAPASRP